ncbi:hypothetical protein CDAR_114861 [Caerostris darwini]|uniref:Uncharacterized protein n=1 Tax=Caerostris darwini TaxID=1538125 RepID=A0AAV4QYG3_9ARAC|nr:hypothetical protein CDAR_114861 [Caerostris darwini]
MICGMPTRFDTPSNRANFGCTMPPAWGYQHQPQFLKWRTWAQPARPAHSLLINNTSCFLKHASQFT